MGRSLCAPPLEVVSLSPINCANQDRIVDALLARRRLVCSMPDISKDDDDGMMRYLLAIGAKLSAAYFGLLSAGGYFDDRSPPAPGAGHGTRR